MECMEKLGVVETLLLGICKQIKLWGGLRSRNLTCEWSLRVITPSYLTAAPPFSLTGQLHSIPKWSALTGQLHNNSVLIMCPHERFLGRHTKYLEWALERCWKMPSELRFPLKMYYCIVHLFMISSSFRKLLVLFAFYLITPLLGTSWTTRTNPWQCHWNAPGTEAEFSLWLGYGHRVLY